MPELPDDLSRHPLLEQLARDLRQPVARNRGVDRAIAALRSQRRQRRSLQLAAAVAILVAGAGIFQNLRSTRPVRFAVRAPDSDRVALVGDFNDWNRETVQLRRRDGEWTITLRLRPGRYRYSFLADGDHWIPDAASPRADDDFNTPTSVVTVAN